VVAQLRRAQAAAAGQGHRQQQLIGEVLGHRGAALLPGAQPADRLVGNLLGAHAAGAKGAEHLGQSRACHFQ